LFSFVPAFLIHASSFRSAPAQGANALRSDKNLLGTVKTTRSGVTILRCQFSPKPVAVRGDEGIEPIKNLSQAGKVVQGLDPP